MTTRRTLILLGPLLAVTLTVGLLPSAPAAEAAKPPSGGCTAASSRIAYSVNVNNVNDLFAVNPEGTCSVQLTTGNKVTAVHAWTADKYMLVSGPANVHRLLYVPSSTNAATVSTMYSWTQAEANLGGISQHRDATGILPVSQQLYVGIENNNVVVYTMDRGMRTQLTNYVSDYVPGGTGATYAANRARWLPDSADRSRIRIAYHLVHTEYVGGVGQSEERGLRILSLSTAGWPMIAVADVTDNWAGGNAEVVGGYPVGDYLHDFARDGSKAAMRGPFGDGIYVVPLIIDDVADTVSFDTANTVHVATNVAEVAIQHGISFSPDASKIVYQASALVGRRNPSRIPSLFVIGAASASGSVEVDGRASDYACCQVWGPNGG